MSIYLRCKCGRLVHAEVEQAGKTLRCPQCQFDIAVPSVQSMDNAATALEPSAASKQWPRSNGTFGEANPLDANGYWKLGLSYWEQDRNEEAVQAFRHATRLDPDDAACHSALGDSLLELKRYDEAAEAYRKAILLDPNDADCYHGLGDAYFMLKRYEDAAANYKSAIQYRPDFAQAFHDLGCAHFERKQYEEAKLAFETAIQVEPDYALAHRALGNTHLRLNRYEEATKSFKQAINLDPNDVRACSNLGYSFLQLKRYNEATVAFERAACLTPDDVQVHRSLGNCYFGLGRFEEAKAMFDIADLLDDLGEKREEPRTDVSPPPTRAKPVQMPVSLVQPEPAKLDREATMNVDGLDFEDERKEGAALAGVWQSNRENVKSNNARGGSTLRDVNSSSTFWSTGLGIVLRWLFYIPVNVILLSVIEWVSLFVLFWIFGANIRALAVIVVLFGAGIIFSVLPFAIIAYFQSIILANKVICPNPKVGVTIFATLYALFSLSHLAQIIGSGAPALLIVTAVILKLIFVATAVAAFISSYSDDVT